MAGMEVAWVERFLGPVLDERTIAIQDSQRARFEKPRLGMSGASLGESVARNLRARRVKITEEDLADAWDAWRVDTQPWVISVTFSYRGREQRATWRYDPHTRELTAVNRLASDLGWVPDGRRPAMRAAAAVRPRVGAKRPAAKKTAAKKTAGRKSGTAKKRSRPKTRAGGAKRRTTTTKKRPATRKRPAAKRRSTVSRRPAAKRASVRKTSARRRPATKRRARR
jgi:hypothetical protein